MLVRLMRVSANARFQILSRDESEIQLLPPLAVGGCDLPQKFDFVQTFAGSFSDRTQWIFCHVHWQSSFFAQETIKPAEQGPTTGEDEPPINQVSRQFRRTTLERDSD